MAEDLRLNLSAGDELVFSASRQMESKSSMPTVGGKATWQEMSSYLFEYALNVRSIRSDGSFEVEVRYRKAAVWKQHLDWSPDTAGSSRPGSSPW